jgi:hypothetical protein
MIVAEKFIKPPVSKYGNILYIQMEVHGIMKHIHSWIKTLSTFFNREKSNGTAHSVFER